MQFPQPPASKRLKQSVLKFLVIASTCDTASGNPSTPINAEASWSSNLDGASSSSRWVVTKYLLDNVFMANNLRNAALTSSSVNEIDAGASLSSDFDQISE